MDSLTLEILPYSLSVLQLSPSAPIPQWIFKDNPFFTISKTNDELSIVTPSSKIQNQQQFKIESGWACLKVVGVLDFSLTGILSSIAKPLADNQVSLFAISTYDTDYILIKEDRLEEATATLINHGFLIKKD